MTKPIKYSEIFSSFQGEGNYTGHLTEWLRFFTCNLQCNGFGQHDPMDESTYDLPYENVNVDDYKTLEELPVFSKGCDSSYSWSKKFKHLQREGTIEQIADRIIDGMKSKYNPKGLFSHGDRHMCFTGGEPLMKLSQVAIVELINEFRFRDNLPSSFTVETNGTQVLSEDLKTLISTLEDEGIEFFFSVSPKLRSVSGEYSDKAIKPLVVAQYYDSSIAGQLKFVCDGTDRAWAELEEHLATFRAAGVNYPVWVMPVGATVEGQELTAATVAKDAIARGYQIAARVHTYVFGNMIGT